MTDRREREQRRLMEVAKEYKAKGYDVLIKPNSDEMPAFLRDFRPDIIAQKDGESVVVAVKTRDSLIDSDEFVRLTEAIAEQPSWRLDLFTTNPQNSSEEGRESLSADETLKLLAKSELLIDSREKELAVLLLSAAMEALIRIQADYENVSLEGKSFLRDAKHLVGYGVLAERDYHLMERIFHFRDMLIHGYKPPSLELRVVRKAIARSIEIAKDAIERKAA